MDKEKVAHVYTHRQTDTHRHVQWNMTTHKKEILLFATTWKELDGLVLSEMSQTEKTNTEWYYLHMEFLHRERLVKRYFFFKVKVKKYTLHYKMNKV